MSEAPIDPEWSAFPPHLPPHQLNPLVLAYMGDAVYEVFIRQYLISLPNHRPHYLHRKATTFVSAKAQARALKYWRSVLTEEEADIVRRGRNAKSGSPPKNTEMMEYRQSTAFECLVGYLYYMRRYDRLRELLDMTVEQSNHKE